MSLKRYFRRRIASERGDSKSVGPKATNGLPKVPGGTLTGLKTFVRRFHKTQKVDATPMSDFSELESQDESYHGVLKANK
jgi:hypothetical protein